MFAQSVSPKGLLAIFAIFLVFMGAIFYGLNEEEKASEQFSAKQVLVLETAGFTTVSVEKSRATATFSSCQLKLDRSGKTWTYQPSGSPNLAIVVTTAAELVANPAAKLEHCS